jgi:excisionase family DNA binding protein
LNLTSANDESKLELERKVYSVENVASILNVSEEHVRRQIRAGLMPHKRVGRCVVIPRKLFEEWLNTPDEGQ